MTKEFKNIVTKPKFRSMVMATTPLTTIPTINSIENKIGPGARERKDEEESSEVGRSKHNLFGAMNVLTTMTTRASIKPTSRIHETTSEKISTIQTTQLPKFASIWSGTAEKIAPGSAVVDNKTSVYAQSKQQNSEIHPQIFGRLVLQREQLDQKSSNSGRHALTTESGATGISEKTTQRNENVEENSLGTSEKPFVHFIREV